jgi:glycosyltransferase involved in cell wall biosynthesis
MAQPELVRPFDQRWLALRARAQEDAMPSGEVAVSCPAPYGVGGLGRHVQEIVEALERRGQAAQCICEGRGAAPTGAVRRRPGVPELIGALAPLVRFSPAWRMWARSVRFDADAARRLAAAEHVIAFNGTALAQFRAHGAKGIQSIGLMSANSHIRRVTRQHELAYRRYPLERPWAVRLVSRNLAEYDRAGTIYVTSRYVWESFAEEGFGEEVLSLFPLTPAPRFQPASPAPASSTYDIVYSGSLLVHKGVPLLVEAFRRLPYDELRLVLVGGWKTRSMRRFIEEARTQDPRISVRPGDPLPHLQAARLCVHPAYEDGFAYAPAEALACGVPVIVSEDTGMKELVDPGRTGLIVPTGDADVLAAALDAAYRGEILSGRR